MIRACGFGRCCNFFSVTSKRQQFKKFCSRTCKERNCEQTSQQRRSTARANARRRWHERADVRAQSVAYKKARYHALTDEQKRAENKKKNDRHAAKRLARHYERMATDTHYMVRQKVADRIRKALKNGYGEKSKSCLEYIGCSVPELRAHLEQQFTDGMSWDNYGQWHIDHVKPCAAFDLADPEQQRECFHYTNLQPLWAVDNLRKGATYE